MAIDMFIKTDDIKGESTDKKHKDEIDILSWTFGAKQSGTSGTGGGAGAGKVAIEDLTFTKYVDIATPTLFKWCCTGKPLKTVKLTVRKSGGDALEYLTISLEEAIVSSVKAGDRIQDRLTETVSLNFAKVKVDYTPQTATGAGGAKVGHGWDCSANAEWT